MQTQRKEDPKGLILEAFRIENIDLSQCRTIFLDWALSLPSDLENTEALTALLATYQAEFPDHPMTEVLQQGLAAHEKPRRRGGWRSRNRPAAD